MRLFLLALQLILLTIIVAQAETVEVVEEGNNTVILMVEIQDQDGLGSFSLTLKYNPNMTKILNVSREGPFTVVGNINNELGVAKIAGFHGQIPGPTGEVRLARLHINGLAEFKIMKMKLYDTKGNLITYQLTSTTPDTSPTTTTPLEQTITTITTVTMSTIPPETNTQVETTTVTIHYLPTKPIERITQTTPKEISKEISKNNTTTTPTTNPTKPTAVIPDFSAASSVLMIILTILILLKKRKH